MSDRIRARWSIAPLALLFVTSGAPLLSQPAPSGGPAAEPAKPKNATHVDHEGFPLPAEAIARVGSARFRNGDVITALVYTPDGKTVIAVSAKGAVHFWNTADGTLRHQVQLKTGFRPAMACRPDGKAVELFG